MTVTQRSNLYKLKVPAFKTNKALVSSTDGRSTIVEPLTNGKKPGTRKRKVNVKTRTVQKVKIHHQASIASPQVLVTKFCHSPPPLLRYWSPNPVINFQDLFVWGNDAVYILPHFSVLQGIIVYYSVLQCIRVYYSVLQCIIVYYSVNMYKPQFAQSIEHNNYFC